MTNISILQEIRLISPLILEAVAAAYKKAERFWELSKMDSLFGCTVQRTP